MPALYAPSPEAAKRFIEYFAANIRNLNTRRAYLHAVREFADWSALQGFHEIVDIEPLHVAAYIEQLTARLAKPSVKQHLLEATGIKLIEYGGGLNSEQAIFSAASDILVQELLDFARAERGVDAIDNNLDIQIPDLTLSAIRGAFTNWELFSALDGQQLREAIAEVADRRRWFKDQRIGRGLAPTVWRIATEAPVSPLAQTLAQIEAWLYA